MRILVVVCVLLTFSTVNGNWLFSSRKKTKSPVIFVPGNGGSQIETKFNKPEVVHYVCAKTQKDWYNIWLNIEELIPVVIDCFIDNVRLYYDIATRTTHNSPGVEIRIPGWGDPFFVEWIDPTKNSAGSYFKDIAKALYDMGYERNKSLRGAPYDFRKAPNENEYWFKDMKKLVEDTYDQNNETPVTIISHSMGSPMTLHLLQNVSSDWKKKYIHRFISLAGAWAGSMKAVKVYAMGDDLDAFLLSGKTMRAEQISMPSLAFLLPNPLFWKPNEVIITTAGRNYTFAQLEDYFNDIGYEIGWEMRLDNLKYSTNFRAPEVEIHCLYGSNKKTVEMLQYKKTKVFEETPSLIYGNGDGTVNSRSLEACTTWKPLQKEKITAVELRDSDHMGILGDQRAVDYIVNLLKEEI